MKVNPSFDRNTLLVGAQSDVSFPEQVQLGISFHFTVGSGNSLFANFVGRSTVGSHVVADPSFGINVVGDVEFEGDPWSVTIKADLSQVWKYVREQVDVSVGWGWFWVDGARYQKIVQDLIKNNVVNVKLEEGSSETEKFGRQILEMGKEIFQEINKQANVGDGYFRFETESDARGWRKWRGKILVEMGSIN